MGNFFDANRPCYGLSLFSSDNQMVGMSGQVGEVWGGQFLVKNKFVLKCFLGNFKCF